MNTVARQGILKRERMKTIYKYPLALTDWQQIRMPEGAEILSAQMQGEDLCLWAMVETSNKSTPRAFEVFGTGNPIHTDMGIDRRYINSVQERVFVWHVFERVN
jgi:hypothetical protein